MRAFLGGTIAGSWKIPLKRMADLGWDQQLIAVAWTNRGAIPKFKFLPCFVATFHVGKAMA